MRALGRSVGFSLRRSRCVQVPDAAMRATLISRTILAWTQRGAAADASAGAVELVHQVPSALRAHTVPRTGAAVAAARGRDAVHGEPEGVGRGAAECGERKKGKRMATVRQVLQSVLPVSQLRDELYAQV